MNQDLYGALKNAVENGSTVEKAVQSFINAGYKQEEVREAAQAISSGATQLTQEPRKVPVSSEGIAKSKMSFFNKSALPQPAQPQAQQPPAPTQQMTAPQPNMEKPVPPQGKVKKSTAIILISIFVLLLAALIMTLVFKDQITSLF